MIPPKRVGLQPTPSRKFNRRRSAEPPRRYTFTRRNAPREKIFPPASRRRGRFKTPGGVDAPARRLRKRPRLNRSLPENSLSTPPSRATAHRNHRGHGRGRYRLGHDPLPATSAARPRIGSAGENKQGGTSQSKHQQSSMQRKGRSKRHGSGWGAMPTTPLVRSGCRRLTPSPTQERAALRRSTTAPS